MAIYVNGRPVNWGKGHFNGSFPSGETKFERSYVPDPVQNLVKLHWGNNGGDEELLYLWYIKRDLDVETPQAKNILEMIFVPNGRLDKERNADSKLLPANEDTGAFINMLGFDRVYGYEPHSSKFEEHYKNAVAIYPTATSLVDVRNAIKSNRNIQWVFPDKGAFERYKDMLPGVVEDDIIIIGKHRTNGEIDKTEIESGTPRPGYDLVIVDDLCSKGGTFYGAGTKLRAAGADCDIYLVISHLEPNVFAGDLLKENSPIKRIFVCTKSLGELHHPNITYLNFNHQEVL
jgi:Phosphoribosylpyrophosphate synthetase